MSTLSEYAHHSCLAKAMEKTRDIGGYKYCDDLHLGKHQSVKESHPLSLHCAPLLLLLSGICL